MRACRHVYEAGTTVRQVRTSSRRVPIVAVRTSAWSMASAFRSRRWVGSRATVSNGCSPRVDIPWWRHRWSCRTTSTSSCSETPRIRPCLRSTCSCATRRRRVTSRGAGAGVPQARRTPVAARVFRSHRPLAGGARCLEGVYRDQPVAMRPCVDSARRPEGRRLQSIGTSARVAMLDGSAGSCSRRPSGRTVSRAVVAMFDGSGSCSRRPSRL